MEENIENLNDIILKTYTFCHKNKTEKIIFDYMTSISKNIYNCTIYCYKVYKQFENNIYKEVYDDIIKNDYIKKLKDIIEKNIENKKKKNKKTKNRDTKGKKKEKKDDIIIKIEEKLYQSYDFYYDFYSINKKLIDNNNCIIYKYIINEIKNNDIVINKTNIDTLFNEYKNNILKIKDIIFDDTNIKLVIDDVIYNILKSIYYKTVFWIKKLININKTEKIDKKYETIINNIKNDDFYIENYNIYSKIIKEQLNIPITTVKNLIGRVTYKHIYENKEKIPADVIGNIIDKTYGNIESYYSLLKSGKQNKTSLCKYLNKDAKFNLFYFCRSFKVEENKIRLNVGDFINNNYKNLIKDCKLDIFQKNKKTFYYNKLDLVNKKLNKNYEKIDEYFIDKTKLQTFNYIYLQLPKKIKDCKIKLIEIKSFYNYIKFYITYEYKLTNKLVDYDLKNFDNLSLEDKLNKSISIDTGVVNLLTIYDPTGKQFIIKGGQILSINHFYNKWLDKLKSLNKKLYNKSKFNRLYSLETERQNKINGYFNNVINLLLEKYSNKELFIIGYNPNWKSGVNLGKKNNRNFYQIPYKRFLNKLDDALKIRNKKLLIVKESYTSICDSLALEEINYHETYKGIRTKRGIFSSSTKKLINSDINGAINIMRKYIPLNKITGRNIFNPQIIKP